MDARERIVHEAHAGFDSLRKEIENLQNLKGQEFNSGVSAVLHSLIVIIERLTLEHRSGQEVSAQAFKAITSALKSLSDRLGLKQH